MDSRSVDQLAALLDKLKTHELDSWEADENSAGKVSVKLVFHDKREDNQRNIDEDPIGAVKLRITHEDTDASQPTHLACVQDYEDHCRKHLSKWNFLYVSGAAMTGITMMRNTKAFTDIAICPRHLVDISNVRIAQHIHTTGEVVSCPIGISPTALHGWATPEGELATVRAAKTAGAVYISSMFASTKLEDIAEAEPTAIRWQQTTLFKDREIIKRVLCRAEAVGVTAIVINVDKRVAELSWNTKRGLTGIPEGTRGPNFPESKITRLYDSASTWDDVALLCKQTSLPVILKGILTPEDLEMAVNAGAKGVIVSNHGGRALDGLPATMDVLRTVVEASKGRVEVFMDGGVRTGADIFKALAYGARMVFIGRPAWWGLAHSGQTGLEDIFRILKEELIYVMQLAGTPTLDDITIDRVYPKMTSSL